MGPYRAILTLFVMICLFFDATALMIFSVFVAKVASTGPETYLERCAWKFCVRWCSGHLHSSHMEPIIEKTVPPDGSLVPGTMDQGPSQEPRTRTRTRYQASLGPSRAGDQARPGPSWAQLIKILSGAGRCMLARIELRKSMLFVMASGRN